MSDCIFCQIVAGDLACSQVYADDDFLAFMDVYPWRPGHVLIIPKRHAMRVGELEEGAGERMFGLATRIAAAIRASTLPCDDLHFLVNDGRAANQSVPHVHMHVLPRQRGDLWILGLELAKRPIVSLLGQAPRVELDRQAALIAAQLR